MPTNAVNKYQSNWQERFNLEQRKAVLDKRVQLIERTAGLLSKVGLVRLAEITLDSESKMARLAAECSMLSKSEAKKRLGCREPIKIDPERATQSAKRRPSVEL